MTEDDMGGGGGMILGQILADVICERFLSFIRSRRLYYYSMALFQ